MRRAISHRIFDKEDMYDPQRFNQEPIFISISSRSQFPREKKRRRKISILIYLPPEFSPQSLFPFTFHFQIIGFSVPFSFPSTKTPPPIPIQIPSTLMTSPIRPTPLSRKNAKKLHKSIPRAFSSRITSLATHPPFLDQPLRLCSLAAGFPPAFHGRISPATLFLCLVSAPFVFV